MGRSQIWPRTLLEVLDQTRGLHNVHHCYRKFWSGGISHFLFFFISSSFASFFLLRKASRSSKVWAPGMILEGLARGESLLLLFPPTASITLFITVSIPLNSSLTDTETSDACIIVPKEAKSLNWNPLGSIQTWGFGLGGERCSSFLFVSLCLLPFYCLPLSLKSFCLIFHLCLGLTY